ncbi:hypothetical protein E2320_001719, partial [Naja naja]
WGSTLTGQNGPIESIGFPDNLLCEWFLHGPENHYVTINFEALDIQHLVEYTKDYLVIQENGLTRYLLGRYCDTTILAAVDTASNLAYIKFVTDVCHINTPGFRLHFDVSADSSNSIGEKTPELSKLCGTVTPGTQVKSSGNKIMVAMVTNQDDSEAYLKIIYTSNENANNKIVMVIYGTIGIKNTDLSCNSRLVSTTTRKSAECMILLGVSLSSYYNCICLITIPFFAIFSSSVCGGLLLSSDNGSLTSPGYDGPSSYTDNLKCEWIIQNPQPSTTTIYFSVENFHLEQHINCQNDYIDIQQ